MTSKPVENLRIYRQIKTPKEKPMLEAISLCFMSVLAMAGSNLKLLIDAEARLDEIEEQNFGK